MWLIRAALRRPITVAGRRHRRGVDGGLRREPDARRHLSRISICPVIYVAQPYGGMSPAQMEGYITYYYEYHFLYVNGIESVESKSIQNTSLLKLTFHAGTDMAEALAQTIGYVNRARAFMPPGTVGTVHHALRRRHRAGRLSRVLEREPQPGRDSGSRAESRPSAVRHAAWSDLAAAIRRQPAHDRDPRRPGPPPFLQHVAGRCDQGGDDGERDHAVGQRQHRRRDADLADERRRLEHQRPARTADSHGRRAADLDPGHRLGQRQHRYSDRLRAGQRPSRRLHSRHEAAERLDVGRRQ